MHILPLSKMYVNTILRIYLIQNELYHLKRIIELMVDAFFFFFFNSVFNLL